MRVFSFLTQTHLLQRREVANRIILFTFLYIAECR
jgi:hypothetical protein